MRALALVACLVLGGCADDGVLRLTDHDSTNRPTIQARLPEELGGATVHLPREVGASTEAPLEGRRCAIAVASLATDTETSAPAHIKNPRSSDYRTRTFQLARLEIRCTDGPAPGTPGMLRGGQPLQVLPLAAIALVLGLLVGLVVARANRPGAGGGAAVGALGLVLLAALGLAALAVWRFEGVFVVTAGLLVLGFGAAGLFAPVIGAEHRAAGVLGVVGAIAGGLPLMLLHAAWTAGGPIAALLLAAAGWVTAIVAATLVGESRRRGRVRAA